MTPTPHDLTPDELDMLTQLLPAVGARWHWMRYQDRRIVRPSVRMVDGVIEAAAADGTPPATVLRAALETLRLQRARRSAAATRAAATRATRQQRRVYTAAQRLRDHTLRPSAHCIICGRALNDADSLSRGIGSECWQAVLAVLARETTEEI